jgi:hypothetical protein
MIHLRNPVFDKEIIPANKEIDYKAEMSSLVGKDKSGHQNH